MMDNPKSRSEALRVTALMPTYNRSAYIQEGLESLLSQSRAPDEIIVIDDGSTDGTEAIVRQYMPRVQYIKKANGGKSTALNVGLQLATGDLIWICDDDDIAVPDGLARMLSTFTSNPDADYVFGTYKIFDEAGSNERVLRDPFVWKRSEEPNLKINFLEDMFILQYASLAKKQIYEQIGGYDVRLIRSQDYDLMLRMSRHNKGVEIPDIIFHYRYHASPRGHAGNVFDFQSSHSQWRKYDRIIFEGIWQSYDLQEFTPTFALGTDHEDRAALVQRAVIMAKRGLWERTAQDLSRVEQEAFRDISQREFHLLQALVHGREPWLMLSNDETALAMLAEIFRRSTLGYKMVATLLRPLLWIIKDAVKSRDPKSAVVYLRLLYRITGSRMIKVLLRKP